MNEENLKPEIAAEETPKPAPVTLEAKKPEQKYATPVAVTIEDIEKSNPVPVAAGPAVVSNNIVDYVRLSAIVYKNEYARKSLSVHHMQRRLNELGYTEAFADKDGYYGDKTREALSRFQAQNKLPSEGTADRVTLELLFTGDPNVSLVD